MKKIINKVIELIDELIESDFLFLFIIVLFGSFLACCIIHRHYLGTPLSNPIRQSVVVEQLVEPCDCQIVLKEEKTRH